MCPTSDISIGLKLAKRISPDINKHTRSYPSVGLPPRFRSLQTQLFKIPLPTPTSHSKVGAAGRNASDSDIAFLLTAHAHLGEGAIATLGLAYTELVAVWRAGCVKDTTRSLITLPPIDKNDGLSAAHHAPPNNAATAHNEHMQPMH